MLDKNDITCEYEPHIWHRHQVEPDEVVAAFFNIEQSVWNFKHNSIEAYSTTDALYIY